MNKTINKTDNTEYIPSMPVAMDQYISQITLSLQTANVQHAIINNVSSTMRFKDIAYIQQGAVM
jgi:hypothetical protein